MVTIIHAGRAEWRQVCMDRIPGAEWDCQCIPSLIIYFLIGVMA